MLRFRALFTAKCTWYTVLWGRGEGVIQKGGCSTVWHARCAVLWGREGGRDGWMDGFSLGPRHGALAAQRPDQQALILFGVPIGLADPRDLGSCVIEPVTRWLMVGPPGLPQNVRAT